MSGNNSTLGSEWVRLNVGGKSELGLSPTLNMANWKAMCREIPLMYFIANPIKIGGQGVIVELDETFISHNKYWRGRNLDLETGRTNTCVFGGIERGTKKMFLVPVPDVTKETLWHYIDKYVEKGSYIMTDGLRSYGGLDNWDVKNFQHDVVLHKYYFVDPENPWIHTNSIESTWQKFKHEQIKNKYGTKEELFTSYIDEFIWKRQFKENRMYEFWKIIYRLYFKC
ncbi:ISXO2-like transposase domain-containing protein [Ditylenchus destructor]|uniref:ISXO2-like transposase domain-containing protein n=1 Tax=Ditylenchus destructor TaxID=166010 RepID=A0AAD4MGM3_9BILA|nr:ISXO2-like transposase domain-containing protein [Ditylenchus destructor]